MGYDIHITRAPHHHAENEGHAISPDEWLAYIKSDPELRLAGYNGDYFVLWAGPSKYPDPWFDWSHGNISTKNPDPAIVRKAIEIAATLGARVQGDDGEIYLADGKIQRDGQLDEGPGMDWRDW